MAALFGGVEFAALKICPMPSWRGPVRRGRPLLKISLGTRPATTTVQITLHGKPQKHRDVEAVSVPKMGAVTGSKEPAVRCFTIS